MIISYLRTCDNNSCSTNMQKIIIDRYCMKHNIQYDLLLKDESAKGLKKNVGSFPSYIKLIKLLSSGLVSRVLVDFSFRLNVNSKYNLVLKELCELYSISVVEAAVDLETQYNAEENDDMKIAVYHFTNGGKEKPLILEKTVDAFYTYILNQPMWDLQGIFIDYSLKDSEHYQYQRLVEECGRFDVVLTKDFYRIDDKTSVFVNKALAFLSNKVQIRSLQEGEIILVRNPKDLRKEKVAVTYDSWNEQEDAALQAEIFDMFVKSKTAWTIKDKYVEHQRVRKDCDQIVLKELIDNSDQYDVVIVESFQRLHWRTGRFFQIISNFKKILPIYSLREGVMMYAGYAN